MRRHCHVRSDRFQTGALRLATLLALVAAPLPAQGRILVPCAEPRPQPTPAPRPCSGQVVRLATSTVIDVEGRVARTTITETFENRGGRLGEADVIMPLPRGAAFEELRLEIDGQLVAGELLDAASARATFTGRARDVVAYLPVQTDRDAAGVTVLTHDDGSGERHALVIVSPPRTTPRVLPRDITLVLDVSGSMSGGKLTQAVAAGHALLATLGAADRLRVIAFADEVDAHTPDLVPVTAATRRAAAQWLDGLAAAGGTNIGDAMRAALAPEQRRTATTARLPLVLLLTDGQPTTGLRAEAIVDSTTAWRGGARLFTFGIGADVDASLVEQLALEGRGTAHFVRPDESIERAVHATFAFGAGEDANAFVPRLWAVQRVAALDSDRRRHGPSTERDAELKALGERFGIPTALTSYLVLEPGMVSRPVRGAAGGGVSSPTGGIAGGRERAAPAPGTVAFEAARTASEQRRTVTLSAADAMLEAADRSAGAGDATAVASGSTFTRRDGVWIDQRLLRDPTWRPALTVRVRPFSDAWTALARALPALHDALALGDQLRLRGRTVLIEVVADGRTTLDDATLRAIRSHW